MHWRMINEQGRKKKNDEERRKKEKEMKEKELMDKDFVYLNCDDSVVDVSKAMEYEQRKP